MEITDIQISLTAEEVRDKDRVYAFARVVFDDCFAVRDLKIMEVHGGYIFLGMPSRKLLDPCPTCRKRTDLSAKCCTHCGIALKPRYVESRRSHVDVTHPLNPMFRRMMEEKVAAAYNEIVDPQYHLKVKPIDGGNSG